MIDNVNPDTLFLELDEARAQRLMSGAPTPNISNLFGSSFSPLGMLGKMMMKGQENLVKKKNKKKKNKKN